MGVGLSRKKITPRPIDPPTSRNSVDVKRGRLCSLTLSAAIAVVSSHARAAGPTEEPAANAETAAEAEASPPAATEAETPSQPPKDPRAMKRLKVGAVLGGVGVLLGATAGGLTHYALTPPCKDSDDVLECDRPSAQSVTDRSAAIGVAGTAAVAGPILGALGGGRFTRGLAGLSDETNIEKRSKVMLGVGAGTLGLGLAQTVAGLTMFTVGLSGALEPVDETDGSEAQDDAQRGQIKDRLRDVRVARSGLALFLVSPTFIATGAAILWRKKKHFDRRTSMSFSISDTYAGAVVQGRF